MTKNDIDADIEPEYKPEFAMPYFFVALFSFAMGILFEWGIHKFL